MNSGSSDHPVTGREDGVRISLVITTYNHARFLGEAISSALAQTVPTDEILVVDDGSQDAPETIVARFPGVRIHRQENRGLAAARNAGLRETSGELLVFLDADDMLLPDAIEKGRDLLALNPDAAFSYGGYRRLYSDGKTYEAEYHPARDECFAQLLRHNPVGMHGTVMYRREAIVRAGGFREELAASEDYDLFLRLCRTARAVSQPDLLADYRQHGSNMSRNSSMMLQWTLNVLNAREDDAKEAGLLDEFKEGRRAWREYYTRVWVDQVMNGPRRISLAREGLGLFRQAPAETANALMKGLCRLPGIRR